MKLVTLYKNITLLWLDASSSVPVILLFQQDSKILKNISHCSDCQETFVIWLILQLPRCWWNACQIKFPQFVTIFSHCSFTLKYLKNQRRDRNQKSVPECCKQRFALMPQWHQSCRTWWHAMYLKPSWQKKIIREAYSPVLKLSIVDLGRLWKFVTSWWELQCFLGSTLS
jgi:hypothetical protein